MAYAKRHQIYSMCQVFKTGKMLPNKKRGGDVEFVYVDKANKEIFWQVLKVHAHNSLMLR